MVETDILGAVIEKFVDPSINLSPLPVLNDDGSERLPALDNHSMGMIFEEPKTTKKPANTSPRAT